MNFFSQLRCMRRICAFTLVTVVLPGLLAQSNSAFATKKPVGLGYPPTKSSQANIIIRGNVVDENGQPLPGVSVKLRNSSIATSTDVEGNFRISVPETGGVLEFNFVGYTLYTANVNKSTTSLSVKLKPSVSELNEVVVVAFATQKKVNVTGSVSTINAEDLVASPVANITNSLIGNAPGISGLQSSGEPGRNATKIYIRGVSTFSGSTDPLVVIDGIEQPAERPYDQLNAMDANEIASVSVLKDAASTAVYGVRAANGVIIVTTKRGNSGTPKISFAANYGVTTPTSLIRSVNSYEWALMRNQAINIQKNSLNDPTNVNLLFTDDELWKFQNNRDYTPAEVDAFSLTPDQKAQLNQSPALYFGSHDFYKEQFGNNGPQQQYNLNVRGGTQKVKYYASLGYFNQGSILKDVEVENTNTGSTYDRFNFRSNFDLEALKNLTISVNVAGQFGTTEGPSFNNLSPFDNNERYKGLLQYIQEGNPAMVPGIVDGRIVTQVNNVGGATSSITNPLGIKGSIQQTPLSVLFLSGTGILDNSLLSSSIKVNHKMDYITPGLSVRGTAGYDDSYSKYTNITSPVRNYRVRRNPTNPNELDFFGGAIGQQNFNQPGTFTSTWNRIYFDAGIDYNRAIGDHHVTGLILGKASLYNMPNDEFNTPSGIQGFVGRLAYNYKEKYQAEFDLGYNGTENFLTGNRFGYFPAYSAGWVPSNESFFPKNKIVTFLKIRGSYGEVGNDQIGNRRYLFLPSTYNLNQGSYYLGNSNGSAPNARYSGILEGFLGNPEVTWERAKKADIGIESRFFSDRLSMVLDFFKEDRDNILTQLGIIPLTFGVNGNSIPPVNVGITENKGYELSLGWKDNVGSFSYGLNSALSYTRNKIVYRAEPMNQYDWKNSTGKAIGQYFGLISDGFFNTPEELANRPYNTYNSNRNVLGDIRYKDLNSDGKIDDQDMGPIGYSNLPRYTYSFRLNLGYKGFDLSALVNGTAKGSFYMPANMTGVFFKGYGNVYQWQYDGVWTPEKVANGQTISYPRPDLNTTQDNSNFRPSDFWLKSTDFLKLKNIELGYTLKDLGVLKKLNVSSLRVFATGNNLFTFKNDLSDYGIDPETANNRQNNGSGYYFPITKVYNFGVNVQF